MNTGTMKTEINPRQIVGYCDVTLSDNNNNINNININSDIEYSSRILTTETSVDYDLRPKCHLYSILLSKKPFILFS